MSTNYRQKAESVINPGLQASIAAARSSLNSSLNNLDLSKNTVNQNYAQSESSRKQQGQINRNNFSNRQLSTGMGRSSVADTGLAGVDLATSADVNKLETSKQGELSNIEMQKNLLNENFGNTENSLRAKAQGDILTLADQLENRDQQLEMQRRQLADQEAAAAFSRSMQQKQYDYNISRQKAQDAAEAAASNEKASKNKFVSAYYDIRERYGGPQARSFIEDNRDDIINRYGMDFYKQMINEEDNYAKSEYESSQNLPQGGQMFGKISTLMGR